MTPVEFERKYHKLLVPYMNQSGHAHSQEVNVNIYCRTGAAAQLPEKDKIVGNIRRELRQAGGLGLIDVQASHKVMIARAFYGKGSPDECAIALRYAIRYGRAKPEGLQHYCDKVAKIGIDCSGFVNNYFKAINRVGVERTIPQYFSLGITRNNIAAMRANDVLIWTNRRGQALVNPQAHIAVLNVPPDRSGNAIVVESASSLMGLGSGTYTFTRVQQGIFRVRRRNGRNSYVRVLGVR